LFVVWPLSVISFLFFFLQKYGLPQYYLQVGFQPEPDLSSLRSVIDEPSSYRLLRPSLSSMLRFGEGAVSI
jgi:hypothetical protein